MRISERIIFALILGATPVAAPAFAFDGAPAASEPVLPPPPIALCAPYLARLDQLMMTALKMLFHWVTSLGLRTR